MASPTTNVTPAARTAPAAPHAEVAHDAGHGSFPPFKPDSFGSQLLWLAIAFGLLWLFMAKVGAPRVGAILSERRGRISGDLNEAERFRNEATAAEQTYEKALADARRSAAKLADEARQTMAAEFAGKKDAEEAKLAQHLAAAEQRIAAVRDKALGEVGAIATDCAEAIVAKLTGAPTRDEIGAAVASSLHVPGTTR